MTAKNWKKYRYSKGFLTQKEAAEYTGLHVGTIVRWHKIGKLTPVTLMQPKKDKHGNDKSKVLSRYYFRKRDLVAALKPHYALYLRFLEKEGKSIRYDK